MRCFMDIGATHLEYRSLGVSGLEENTMLCIQCDVPK